MRKGGVAKANRPDQARPGKARQGHASQANTALCAPHCGRQKTPEVTEHKTQMLRILRPPHLSDPSDTQWSNSAVAGDLGSAGRRGEAGMKGKSRWGRNGEGRAKYGEQDSRQDIGSMTKMTKER